MGLAVSLPPITLELPAKVQKINDKIAFLVSVAWFWQFCKILIVQWLLLEFF